MQQPPPVCRTGCRRMRCAVATMATSGDWGHGTRTVTRFFMCGGQHVTCFVPRAVHGLFLSRSSRFVTPVSTGVTTTKPRRGEVACGSSPRRVSEPSAWSGSQTVYIVVSKRRRVFRSAKSGASQMDAVQSASPKELPQLTSSWTFGSLYGCVLLSVSHPQNASVSDQVMFVAAGFGWGECKPVAWSSTGGLARFLTSRRKRWTSLAEIGWALT